ncbi:velvet factor, partial [Sporodiniella umbellata]
SSVIPPLKLARPSQLHRKYKLHLIQNPQRARCCGFGEKDKRPIDPPPILKLTLYDETGEQDRALVNTIRSSATTKGCTLKKNAKDKLEHVRNLIGSVASNAHYLYDQNTVPGIYFIFQDLSIRLEGVYTLKFIFINLEEGDPLTMSTSVRLEILSQPFTVYTAKKFPGMTRSTAISRCFAKQGIKIPLR